MQPCPRARDPVWPGHPHGMGCLSARATDTGLPTIVWRLCLGLDFAIIPPILAGVLVGCAWVQALVFSLHSWVGFAVGAVGLGFWLAARHSWLGFSGVYPCSRALPVPRHCSLGCVVWVFVLGLGFRLRPATPGWGIGVCVCAFGCALPLYPATPGWSVRSGFCVLGLGLPLRPATLGWGVAVCVCLCARSACTPQLLVGVSGVVVCAWARISVAPRHSWLGCALQVCVLVLRLRVRPATPGWGVRCWCVCIGSGVCVLV